jgi:lauroyl/myristoyl acyltransferase
MLPDSAWTSYLAARATALRCARAGIAATSIGRAEARLQAYLGMGQEQAQAHARRCFLYSGDAAFHDQLLASGSADLLRAIVEQTGVDDLPLARERGRGALAVTLHYGLATSILPLWLAMASRSGAIPQVGVIQNSRRNPSVMLSAERHASLAACGFPFTDLDLARLGEVAAMRHALAILRQGGIVLIFADGQLPQASAKRTFTCRLGRGSLVLPRGAEWLARSADVPLLPLLVRPEGDGNRLLALNACAPGQVQGALQALVDAAMDFDPAPWSRWCCSADHF